MNGSGKDGEFCGHCGGVGRDDAEMCDAFRDACRDAYRDHWSVSGNVGGDDAQMRDAFRYHLSGGVGRNDAEMQDAYRGHLSGDVAEMRGAEGTGGFFGHHGNDVDKKHDGSQSIAAYYFGKMLMSGEVSIELFLLNL